MIAVFFALLHADQHDGFFSHVGLGVVARAYQVLIGSKLAAINPLIVVVVYTTIVVLPFYLIKRFRRA